MGNTLARIIRANNKDWQDIKLFVVRTDFSSGKALGTLVRSYEARADRILRKYDLNMVGGISNLVFNLIVDLDLGVLPKTKFDREIKRLRKRWQAGEFANTWGKDCTGEFSILEEGGKK